MRRRVAALVTALIASACGATTAPAPSATEAVPTTAASSSRPAPTTTRALVPVTEPIRTLPPFDHDRVVVVDVGRRGDRTQPEGLTMELQDCGLGFPGHLVAWVDWQVEPDVDLPIAVEVAFEIAQGDTGAGLRGVATLSDPGPTLLVFSVALFVDSLGEHFDLEEEGFDVGRRSSRLRTSGRCALSLPDGDTDFSVPFDEKPVSLTPPTGDPTTLEDLAWTIDFSDPTTPLLPLGHLVGEARDPYADVVYIPSDPPLLEEMWEELSDDLSCLRVVSKYDVAVVVQERGCPAASMDPAQGVTRTERSLGDWTVHVTGEDPATVEALADGLVGYTNAHLRPIPPVNNLYEEVVGRGELGGREVLITVGECHGPCGGSPEGWFFLYIEEADGSYGELAAYPAWDRCLLAEEEEFMVGVAPKWGYVEIERSGEIERVDGPGNHPAAIVSTAEADDLRIFGERGETPLCISKRANDPRGGVGPHPSSVLGGDGTPSPPEVVLLPCSVLPMHYEDEGFDPPIAQVCVDIPRGRMTLTHVGATDAVAEPPDGLECLIHWHADSSGAGCWPEGAERSGDFGWWHDEDIAYAMAFVDADATLARVRTDQGWVVGVEPVDRIAFFWWSTHDGDLDRLEVITPDGIHVISEG